MPKIIHVHGALGTISEDQINARHYSMLSERIKFITDSMETPSVEVHSAKSVLAQAAQVYSVGFACEQLNLELLAASQWGNKTVALNFNGN